MTDTDYKVCRSCSRIDYERDFDYLRGVVITPYGFVYVYSQGNQSSRNLSSFEFIWNGRKHDRRIRKRMTARGLATVATRFAREKAKAS